jgi:hypothetical protein
MNQRAQELHLAIVLQGALASGGDQTLARPHVRPMDFTGRPMRGVVTVQPEGLKGAQPGGWVREAVARAMSVPPR